MDQGVAFIVGITIASVPLAALTVATVRNNRTQREIRDVVVDTHKQVVTLNESTIGELAAAGETRRATGIEHDARTAREQRHIDTAPPDEPPQGATE